MTSAEREPAPASRNKPRFSRRVLRNPLTHLVLALLLVSLVQGFIVKLYSVESSSMEHTLTASDRILVNRLAYAFESPTAGDVITFTVPDSWHQPSPFEIDSPAEYVVRLFGEVTGIGKPLSVTNVKRVVAGPGQVISSGPDGVLLVDGEPMVSAESGVPYPTGVAQVNCVEPTSHSTASCFEFVVPEGEYVVAGDNRPNSSDSLSRCRVEASDDCVRTVPESNIVGQVFFVMFPNTRGI